MPEEVMYNKPLPELTRQSRPFWEACKRHELLVQKCTQCGRFHLPPADLCPACAGKLEWVKASGKGKVHTYIIMHQLYHQGFKGDLPYNVTVVELEEGPYLMTNLVKIANKDIQVGMPVRVCFEDVTPDESIHRFEPA